jgi:hypothetical protein
MKAGTRPATGDKVRVAGAPQEDGTAEQPTKQSAAKKLRRKQSRSEGAVSVFSAPGDRGLCPKFVELTVSGMRVPLAVATISIAVLVSPLDCGQAAPRKPSGAIAGSPTKPSSPPAGDALSNLAGGGYADPNYVPPGTQSQKPTQHRAARARHRVTHSFAGYIFEGYRAYKAFPCCCCYCDF